jgi:K+-sensing histidine kinase KdpD
VAATILTLVVRTVPSKGFVPLVFLCVILFIALRFGSAAGILGTVGAAVIFAEFLFDPFLSIRVGDPVQKNYLIWMFIIGIAASELAGIRPKHSNPPAAPKPPV